ncbi:MAG: hypothetical protein DRJ11_10370 [Candidatus Aminicenantes bacterium]|nr:MAG: hypothetical protein DRJ11_10370 [Candidatus Aminicenantes bacterium]
MNSSLLSGIYQMKNKHLMIVKEIFLLMLISFALEAPGFSQYPQEVALDYLFSFPAKSNEAQGVYLFGALFLEADKVNNIYVVNSRGNNIFVFSPKGNFLKKFGTPGQGPGEFQSPKEIFISEEYIIVHDTFNHRLQFFYGSFKFVKSIKLYKTYSSLAVDPKRKLIFASPINKRINPKKRQLIDVLDFEGKLLHSFGRPFLPSLPLPPINPCKLALLPGGEIVMASVNSAKIRKYSSKGELLKENNIDYQEIKELEQRNIKSFKNISRGKRTPFSHIIEAIDVNKNWIYLLHNGSSQTYIFKLDRQLNLIKVFHCLRPPESYFMDLEVVLNNNTEKFYLLQASPENKIDVYINNTKGG